MLNVILANACVQFIVMIEYPMMSLFFVTASHLANSAPIFYANHLAKRSWAPYYAVIHLITYSTCICATIVLILLPNGAMELGNLRISTILITFMSAVSLATLLTTIRAIITAVTYNRKKCFNSTRTQHRKRLISFIIYCIPMNIIGFPFIVMGPACLLLILYPDSLILINIMIVGRSIISDTNNYRTLAIGITTLTAFTSYRNAVRNLLRLHRIPCFLTERIVQVRRIAF
ncbi:unnamed protein product [Toxocara canis]|nr:unnamed protein product [Toxocara canis]